MRIGVLGGSFDPVHRGHLHLATRAAERLGLDQVRFVPARAQPLKSGRHHAAPEDRVAMLAAALEGMPRFVVDTREIRRPGPSYTVDTLRELKLEHPRDQLFFLLGADTARELGNWREAEVLPSLATLVFMPRPGAETPELPGSVTLDADPVDISASGVRADVARGRPIDHLVPAGVAAYIAEHGLYRTGD